MLTDFTNKVVWITGGGTGIGKALAVEFARKGADVAVSGRRQHKLDEAVDQIQDTGVEGLAVQCDVTQEDRVERAVEEVADHFGRLDVSVANAGYSCHGSIRKLNAEQWRRQLDVNVVGLAMTARYSIPHLERTGGRLALMGSVMGQLNLPKNGAYSASKHAVRAIGETLSMELADTEVSCTTIQPGFVKSEIHKVDNMGQRHEDWTESRPESLMWAAEDAAEVMVRAIARRKREYTFTGHGRLAAFLAQHAPGLVDLAVSLQKKWGSDDS